MTDLSNLCRVTGNGAMFCKPELIFSICNQVKTDEGHKEYYAMESDWKEKSQVLRYCVSLMFVSLINFQDASNNNTILT